jgi:hypothetical protein
MKRLAGNPGDGLPCRTGALSCMCMAQLTRFHRGHFDIDEFVLGHEFFASLAECFDEEWRFTELVRFLGKDHIAHVAPARSAFDEVGAELAGKIGGSISAFRIVGKTLTYGFVGVVEKDAIAVIERRNDLVHGASRMHFAGYWWGGGLVEVVYT